MQRFFSTKTLLATLFIFLLISCKKEQKDGGSNENSSTATVPFTWKGANVYFLLTDRFNNGDPSNDINFERTEETAVLRDFMGGDLKGVTQKIRSGYFTDLGINAIWMTPVVEQIHGGTDEGTGFTYPYHGYWTSDWTTLDPNFGTREDLRELVEAAHQRGIRILLDAVINHTGPVTEKDPVWPSDWVRTSPPCAFEDFESTVSCTLVENLPDIKTESDQEVSIPPALAAKWKKEGRYDTEMAELDSFFQETGLPRAPRFYIMKWLADYIEDFGIDGYRVDTVKHTETYVWEEFRAVCDRAFNSWKTQNPDKKLDDNGFYLVGEVYFYDINSGKYYDFGDRKENYFDDSFDALINFNLRTTAQLPYEEVFRKYDSILHTDLEGYSTLNYLSSHDDSSPFDKQREKPFETATRLLLAPGASQVFYGDEIARPLVVDGATGDANLRSFMDWEAAQSDPGTQEILSHWQKLGRFRAAHPAVGAGRHKMISAQPYVFSRIYSTEGVADRVVVAPALLDGPQRIEVKGVFEDGITLNDAYSGRSYTVKNGQVAIDDHKGIVLLETQ